MNWQTKEVQNWLTMSAILYEDCSSSQIGNLVESWLLEKFDGSSTDYLRTLMIIDFLRKVKWESLTIVSKTETEILQKLQEYLYRLSVVKCKESVT